jgi:hypothetical protein
VNEMQFFAITDSVLTGLYIFRKNSATQTSASFKNLLASAEFLAFNLKSTG